MILPLSPASLPAADTPIPVILISVDTLRADHLSCYGYRSLATPSIDSLARGGTIFSEISSQIPITLPSHVSLFTSTYPFVTGIEENGEVLPRGAVTLATLLKSHGYRTAAFIGGYFLARRFGLSQGFDVYDSPFDSRAIRGALDLKRPAAGVTASACAWLKSNSNVPFFVFVHLFDLHLPYDPPAKYQALSSKSDYDAEVAYVDDVLGGFLQFLRGTGIYQRSLVVLISDHGESLGDHGEHTHGYFVYQSTLHVPLIIHWPEGGHVVAGESGRPGPAPVYPERIDSPASLIDVAPTVLQVLQIQAPVSFAGHSLIEFLGPVTTAGREVYSESTYAHDKFGWSSLRSLRVGNYQYIETPRAEFYNLSEDPGELHNLYATRRPLALAYGERLKAFRASDPPQAAGGDNRVSPEVLENLRSLGYLGVSASRQGDASGGADPKDHLQEYLKYLQAEHQAQTGGVGDAASLFAEIVREDPSNLPAHFELARCELALHRNNDAAAQFQAVLALDPQNVEAGELLGGLWVEMGQEGRAEAEFRHLLKIEPGDFAAEYSLGMIAARQRKFEEAVQDFHAALVTRPRSAGTHYNLGLVLETLGRTQEARQEFEEALKDDPDLLAARTALDRVESN
ncbi:MAG TPA: sulfatase-like hydrolase/transferase [Terriglobia bacterium]